jgi:hypothetical protein
MLCVTALKTSANDQSTLVPFFLLFAAVLTPLNFVVIHGTVFGGQLRVLLLVALLGMALYRPLATTANNA